MVCAGPPGTPRYSRPVSYQVATPVFEGPFDLLLHLITKEQVDIYEVSLSTIVDAYLVELERMQALDLEMATEFLLIAAILTTEQMREMRRLAAGLGMAALVEVHSAEEMAQAIAAGATIIVSGMEVLMP